MLGHERLLPLAGGGTVGSRRSGGAVHAAQRGASDLRDQSHSLGGVGEDELCVDTLVDRLPDDGQRLVLEGDDHQRLSPGAGAPPTLGQHNAEILGALGGLTPDQLAELEAEGAV